MTAQCGWAAFTEEQGPKFLKRIFETPQNPSTEQRTPATLMNTTGMINLEESRPELQEWVH